MPNRAERELQKRIAAMTDQEREDYFERERLEKIKRSYKPSKESWPNRRDVEPDVNNENRYLIDCLDDGFHMMLGVYFINNSSEPLRRVRYQAGGWLSADDETIAAGSGNPREYENVQPGEAVRFDFYDQLYGSDVMMQRFVEVTLQNGTVLKLSGELTKGTPSGAMKSV